MYTWVKTEYCRLNSFDKVFKFKTKLRVYVMVYIA